MGEHIVNTDTELLESTLHGTLVMLDMKLIPQTDSSNHFTRQSESLLNSSERSPTSTTNLDVRGSNRFPEVPTGSIT